MLLMNTLPGNVHSLSGQIKTPAQLKKKDNHREYVICCLIMSNSTDKKNHVTVTDDREIRSPVCIQALFYCMYSLKSLLFMIQSSNV